VRPPIGDRPPGYRPPGYRPPGYRPPLGRPPYYRPPHYIYGPYFYNPGWGWFFTAAVVGSTLVYTTSLPADQQCQKVTQDGETMYLCDGVLYRATFYQDEKVYEIVSDPPPDSAGGPQDVVGLGLRDPMTRGDIVRDLQNRLVAAGYDVGGADGVFGSATETALMWFQYDNGMQTTGVVDPATAVALGYESPADPAMAPVAPAAPGGLPVPAADPQE
jgi:Putative peptidoglycan binding domain